MIKKLSALLLLLAFSAQAGLPPTTSKDSSDSSNITTFNYQFPNFTGTHTGITFSLGINSAAGGGTGISTASSTGVPVISSGTWSVDSVLPISLGGTDNGSLPVTAGGIIYTDGTKFQNVGVGTSGQALLSAGASSPTWGTVLINPMTTLYDMIVGGASGVATRLANGTTGQLLMATTSAVESWVGIPGNSTVLKAPTVSTANTSYTTGGFNVLSVTGYIFYFTSASATVGATYTNNGATFTVLQTVASGTLLFATGTGPPAASGTLTKASGTGDSSISFTSIQGLYTYTTPTSPAPLYLNVTAIGAGGGGAGSDVGGGTGASSGSPGQATYFGTASIECAGGSGGGTLYATYVGGYGGACTIGSYAGLFGSGNAGSGGGYFTYSPGATGGSSIIGGAGGSAGTNGAAAVAHSGAGGGGGGTQGVLGECGGGGGGGGFAQDIIIPSPAATYYFSIGFGGAGGAAGTANYYAGAYGADGQIAVKEIYQ